jgi:putative phosphoribosyl transferase
MRYANRLTAGRHLARMAARLRGQAPLVLALPRGGVPVASELADAWHAPLDIIVVRKLGVPHQPELAFGAIGEGGARVLNDAVVRGTQLTAADIAPVEQHEAAELARRAQSLRPSGFRVPMADRLVVIVDDGIATGATVIAACMVARAHGARRIVVAVPVAAREAVDRVLAYADEVVCPLLPTDLGAVGSWYGDFTQVSEREVVALLQRAHTRQYGR